MTTKDRVDKLVRLLLRHLPELEVTVNVNSNPTGEWLIDTWIGKRGYIVSYRPNAWFGLTSEATAGWGEGPDEIFDTDQEVVARLCELIPTGAPTVLGREHVRAVKTIRERRQVSQTAMAAKLKVRQPTISKLESREDMSVSTLRRYIHALGGTLRVSAQFPDGTVEIGGGEKVAGRARRRKRRATMPR